MKTYWDKRDPCYLLIGETLDSRETNNPVQEILQQNVKVDKRNCRETKVCGSKEKNTKLHRR